MVVAIDGPSGVGKSTVARAVASALGVPYLDTGSYYRAVTHVALRAGVDPSDESGILDAVAAANFEVVDGALTLDGADISAEIRGPAVTAAVSTVAAHAAVRETVVEMQRDWAAAQDGSAVVEGRDIGTVVFPDAPLKVFLDADPGVRARRRLLQRGEEPEPGMLARETDLLAGRDRADSGREVAPLRPAADAVRLSTDTLTFEEQVDRILALAAEAGLSEGPRSS